MTTLQETTSSPVIRAESRYLRGLFRDKKIATAKSEWTAEETLASSSTAYDLNDIEKIKRHFRVEEQVEETLFSHIVITRESALVSTLGYENLIRNLLKLQSSKAYSIERTSPFVNILDKIWVNCVSSLEWWRLKIDRIHRNFTFDITSSDPVEDFVQIESPKEIKKSDYGSRTLLGHRLLAIRARIVDSGKQLFDWEEIEREVANRRGGAE